MCNFLTDNQYMHNLALFEASIQVRSFSAEKDLVAVHIRSHSTDLVWLVRAEYPGSIATGVLG